MVTIWVDDLGSASSREVEEVPGIFVEAQQGARWARLVDRETRVEVVVGFAASRVS
jgi:hypothetical protein